MKKRYILIFIILIFLILGIFSSLYFIDNNRMKNGDPVFFSTWGKKYSPIEKNKEIENIPPIEEIKEPEYEDENPVKLGIYLKKGNNLVLTNDHSCNWSPENVMGVFYAIPTQEELLPSYNFNTMWKEYINKYENPDSYRIGYSLDFTLNDGSNMHYQILNPDDAYYTFPKVMSFLYDDVNLVPGKPYYHITQDVMYGYTICSSIKLVGDVDTHNIVSDITLTAFCWDSEDDFDPETGYYRGNCSYTTIIKEN